MRALFLTPSLRAGGSERQLSLLLPALRARGIDARVIALDHGGPFVGPLRAAGVPVEVLDMRHQADARALARSHLLRRFRPDVVVSIGVSGLYIGAALAAVHGAAHLYSDHRGVGVALSHRRAAMIRLLARRLDGVIVVSDDQRAGWVAWGCPPERVVRIVNGVSATVVPESRAAIRASLAVAPDAVLALLVASLKPLKRVGDFIAAVRLAREQVPLLEALVAGEGPSRAAAERAIGGETAIRLLGLRDDVPRLLRAADVLVLCSDHEALPMAVLEGMAAGLPVLATRVGALPELVADGVSGLLVAPRDVDGLAAGLVRLAGDPELRERMGAAAQARVQAEFGLEAMVDAYAALLGTAVRGRRGRSLPERYLRLVHERGWVTWERVTPGASVLMVVNAWPDREQPMRGAFARRTVDGLAAAGVASDVLYVRGYRGTRAYAFAALAMVAVCLARRYRLVHSHAGETALAARCHPRGPVLASYWGTDVLGGSGLGGQRLGTWRYRLKVRGVSALVRAHSLTLTATTTKTAEMEGRLPARVRARNTVIPDGVDRARFAPADRRAARERLGWPEDEVTVITVGRRDPLKRLALAEAAAAAAARLVPGLRWRAISDLPADAMPACYNAADLLLHTSASEGSPNAIKEALACNLPVVATPAGDIPSLLDGVEPSALCPPEVDALAAAIVACLRTGRRSNGRARTEHLSLEATTARTRALYRRLGVV